MTTDTATTTTPAPVETRPIEVVTPIKPSEAIRLGCLTTAPGKGTYVAKRRGQWEACAYGAMAVGFGYDPEPVGAHRQRIDDYLLFGEPFIAAAVDGPCPEPGCAARSYDVLIHLNDDHRWSRERIADWLESIGL